MIANLWRHKPLILRTVAVALALGIVVWFAMPIRYTAEAYVHGGFAAPRSVTAGGNSGSGPIVSFDASLLVETRARLLQSHQLARRVVERLGLERLRSELGAGSFPSWLQVLLYGMAARAPDYQADRAAATLLRGLSVKTEPRVYRIAVRYTAGDPELAALITNTFVTEFLRIIRLQTLSDQLAAARNALSEQLATFGEKHHNVTAARVRVAAADALFKAQLDKTPEEIEGAAGENVTFAQAIAIPSSPNGQIIMGIALLAGLVVGSGLVLWAERYGSPSQSLRTDQNNSVAPKAVTARRLPQRRRASATAGGNGVQTVDEPSSPL